MNPRSLIKKLVPRALFRAVEPYGHLLESIIFQSVYGLPGHKVKVIGVTGTDGKTSTATLITQMLRHSGLSVAMMSTISIDYGDGKGAIPNPSRMTTMGAPQLARALKQMRENKVEWLVLEVTSHALSQYRTWGVPIHLAVMTNLSHEHLDYHGTFERYRDAKVRLFGLAHRNPNGLRIGILNADDENASYFIEAIANPISYGIKQGDLHATKIKLLPSGSRFVARIEGDEYRIETHLPGQFNVYNALAAIGVGRAIGLTKQQVEQGIASLDGVEGRMTRVDEGQDFSVIVDYAHTPDSFRKIFEEVKPLTEGQLIVVFGSAGRRDEKKRAAQGKVAGKYCDIVIASEEDDRDIDGQEILAQIASGAEEAGKTKNKDLFLIHDRFEAVEYAMRTAKKGDMVLLLGKGHEKSILRNGPRAAELRGVQQDDANSERVIKIDYDEVQVARKALKARS